MKKNFIKFNILGLFLILVLLLGIGFVFYKYKTAEIITDNYIKPISHEYFENNIITTTEEIAVEQFVEERDSSTSSSYAEATEDSAQNDELILPEEFLLNVPFTSQAPEKNWDQPWQDACEEAALLMLDAYYKDYNLSPLFSRDEILKIVKWEEEKNWGTSIEIEKVKEIGEEYFKLNDFKEVENSTVEQIKKSIVNGNPVLVVADGKVLPNPHFRNGGPVYHVLIIKGYDEDEFITNDPGTQFGENFKYKYDDLLNAIHDWNDGDVKNGRRVVLMVE